MWKNLVADKKFKSEKDKTNYQSCKIEIDGNTLDSIGVRFKGESSYDFQTNKKNHSRSSLAGLLRSKSTKGCKKLV
jgi:spore coat protein CotH